VVYPGFRVQAGKLDFEDSSGRQNRLFPSINQPNNLCRQPWTSIQPILLCVFLLANGPFLTLVAHEENIGPSQPRCAKHHVCPFDFVFLSWTVEILIFYPKKENIIILKKQYRRKNFTNKYPERWLAFVRRARHLIKWALRHGRCDHHFFLYISSKYRCSICSHTNTHLHHTHTTLYTIRPITILKYEVTSL
jgi:hypothetical protein